MVEQIVAFTLGFCICGLIGLALLPLVSGRARRLTLLRIEDRLPMTFEEIEADRDLLRARFAVEKRELEIKAQEARDTRAGDAIELGRRAVQLTRVNEQLDQTDALLRERGEHLARALQFGETTKAELAGVRASLAEKQAEYDALAEAHRQLDARAGDLDSGFAATTLELRDVRARLEAAQKEQQELSAQVAAANSEIARLQAALQEAQSRIAAAERQTAAEAGPESQATVDEAEISALRAAISRIGHDVARLEAQN